MKKRFLNLFLVLLIVACVLPTGADAATKCWHSKNSKYCTVEKVDAKPATCVEDGYEEHYVCTFCENVMELSGSTYVEAEKPILKATGVHDFNVKKETVAAATCTTAKQVKYKCKSCNATEVRASGNALNHDYPAEGTVTRQPTCTVYGLRKIKCSRCDDVKTERIDKLAHTIVGYTEDPATCIKDGTTAGRKCTVCNTVLAGLETIPATGVHDFSVYVEKVSDETCTAKRVNIYKCATCEETKEIEVSVPLNHAWDEGTITREPTCQKYGLKKFKCTRTGCNETKVENIAKLTCNIIETEAVAPTCMEKGKTAGTKCTACRVDGKYTCAYCKENMVPQQYIDKLSHSYTVPFRVVKEATCTEDGSTVFKCASVCNGYLELPVKALGHVEVEQEKWEPTCTKDGIKETKCTRCNTAILTKIDALGHTETAVTGTPASCTATGLTDGVKCATCQATIIAQEEIPMLDHTWKVVPAVEKTCTTDGNNEYKQCEVCGATLNKEVYPAGHVFENYKCTVCGERDSSCEHKNAEITVNDSTCTTAGTKKFNCPDCGDKYEVALPLADHQRLDQSVAATCTTKGKTHIVCAICNTDIVGPTEIPTIAHTNVNGTCSSCGASVCDHSNTTQSTHASTCMERGYVTETCNSCGYSTTTELALAQHNHVNGVCTVCGHKDSNRVTFDYQDVFIVG